MNWVCDNSTQLVSCVDHSVMRTWSHNYTPWRATTVGLPLPARGKIAPLISWLPHVCCSWIGRIIIFELALTEFSVQCNVIKDRFSWNWVVYKLPCQPNEAKIMLSKYFFSELRSEGLKLCVILNSSVISCFGMFWSVRPITPLPKKNWCTCHPKDLS